MSDVTLCCSRFYNFFRWWPGTSHLLVPLELFLVHRLPLISYRLPYKGAGFFVLRRDYSVTVLIDMTGQRFLVVQAGL